MKLHFTQAYKRSETSSRRGLALASWPEVKAPRQDTEKCSDGLAVPVVRSCELFRLLLLLLLLLMLLMLLLLLLLLLLLSR